MSQYEINPLARQRKHKTTEDTIRGTLSTPGSRGNLYRLNDVDDTWYPANHTSEANAEGLLGILLGGSQLLLSGSYKTSGLNESGTYLVGPTDGSISTVEPTTEDYVLRVVGYAISSTELLFDPSKDYFTVTEIDQPIDTVTGDTLLDLTYETVLVDASGGNVTITLPTAVGNKGKIYNIKKIDSSTNLVTTNADGTELIDGSLIKIIKYQWNCMDIQSDNIGWYII